ncbi:glucose oxidase [Dendryphion nanum]|uniref:Glucose oxidase n=1 Tax=Dendryphion nanum TaxID=256645 RepID=A0A9P9IDQ2_9PLEO|nr:glucose oxidase [Dendryphion nanum]
MRTVLFSAAIAAFPAAALAAPADPYETFQYANIVRRAGDLRKSYDYVIAGAGTAGLTLADRLTESGKYTVLVIEYCYPISDETIAQSDGRWFSFIDPGIQYNITSIPQPDMNNRSQFVWLGCCVGGSSAINGMVYVRGTKPEYDGWAELGGPGSQQWNWDGVLPYFKKAAHFNPPTPEVAKNFNITWNPNSWGQDPKTKLYASFPNWQQPAMIPFYKAAAAMPGMPRPIDGASGKSGLFWNPTSVDNVKYWRSYSRTAHYDNIRRDNYDVITMHKVKRVLFDGNEATGVEFTSRETSKTFTVKAKKEVILSAGTIHTPQILQLSGIGPKNLLQKAGIKVRVELPGVGQNFQDHMWLTVGYRWGNGTGPTANITQTGSNTTVVSPNLGAWIGLPTMTDKYEDFARRYESQKPAQYLPKDTHPTVVDGYADFQKLHAKLLRDVDAHWLWLPITGQPGGIVMSEHIVSHGTVNIDPASPDSSPIVDYRALSNPLDLDIMVENVEYMRKYMKSPIFAPYQPIETDPGIEVKGEALREWIRQVLIPSNFHPVATAKKAPKEKGGVVDERLRVHGTKGLRVVDGSIMPLLPGANTQQSVYMIAEKAADIIKAAQ